MVVGLSFLSELAFVKGGQFLNSCPVAVVIIFEFVSKARVVVDEACDLGFSFLAGSLEPVVGLVDLVLFLLDFVGEPLDLGFVEVLQLVLVFPMLPHQVVLHVFVFCLEEIDFVELLLF